MQLDKSVFEGSLSTIKSTIDDLIQEHGPDASVEIRATMQPECGYGGEWVESPSIEVVLTKSKKA